MVIFKVQNRQPSFIDCNQRSKSPPMTVQSRLLASWLLHLYTCLETRSHYLPLDGLELSEICLPCARIKDFSTMPGLAVRFWIFPLCFWRFPASRSLSRVILNFTLVYFVCVLTLTTTLRGQRTIGRDWFSFSTVWFPGIELGSSVLAESAFTCGVCWPHPQTLLDFVDNRTLLDENKNC